jgi:hypothetical protein
MGMLLALALAGCGGYFDQHPANVRPEGEAVAAILGAPAHTPVVQPEVVPLAPPAPPAPAEQNIPAAPVVRASAPPPAPVEPPSVPPSAPMIVAAPENPSPSAPPMPMPEPPPQTEPAPAVVVSNPPPPPSQTAEAQPAITPAAPNPVSAPDSHCAAVAKQRADDAAAGGSDSDTQTIVRDGTYKDCMAWQAAHPSP